MPKVNTARPFVMDENAPEENSNYHRFSPSLYFAGRRVARILLRMLYRLEAIHAERVPADGGAILVANHASFLDIPAIGCTMARHIKFVGRDTLDKIPILGLFIRHVGILYIKRGAADIAALRQIANAAQSGALVAIFPEGTRSQNGRFQTIRPGVLLAARLSRMPIVPVGIAGTYEALPRQRKIPRLRGRIVVSYGEPFYLGGAGSDALDRVSASIAAEIENASAARSAARAGRNDESNARECIQNTARSNERNEIES